MRAASQMSALRLCSLMRTPSQDGLLRAAAFNMKGACAVFRRSFSDASRPKTVGALSKPVPPKIQSIPRATPEIQAWLKKLETTPPACLATPLNSVQDPALYRNIQYKTFHVRLRAFHPWFLNKAVKLLKQEVQKDSVKFVSRFKKEISIPRKIRRFSVLRSPFVHKKSMDQFEIRWYSRGLEFDWIKGKETYDVQTFLRKVRWGYFSHVGATIYSRQTVYMLM